MLGVMCTHGIEFEVKKSECRFVRTLDEQKAHNTKIFGGGCLISSAKAAEHAEIDKKMHNDVICWKLSESEKEIINKLS